MYNFQWFFPFQLARERRTNIPAGRFLVLPKKGLHRASLLRFKPGWILSRSSVIAEISLRARTSQPRVILGLVGAEMKLPPPLRNWELIPCNRYIFLSLSLSLLPLPSSLPSSLINLPVLKSCSVPFKPVSVTRVTGKSADEFCLPRALSEQGISSVFWPHWVSKTLDQQPMRYEPERKVLEYSIFPLGQQSQEIELWQMRKAMFKRSEKYIPALSENVADRFYVSISAPAVSTLW